MKKEILIKFLNNQCSREELDVVVEWIKTEALTDESKDFGFAGWESFKAGDDFDNEKFSLIFDKIQNRIETEEQNSKGKTEFWPVFSRWMTRAAAILLIPVAGFLFYTLSEKQNIPGQYVDNAVDSLEIIAPAGSRTVVQLADGTEVNLNYGSKIKYPRNFIGNTREILLTGEGYFNVAHNPDKPFIVKARNLRVKALGTEFNVQAYPGQDEVATTLAKGNVLIEKETSGNLKPIGTMVPGQHVIYNLKSGKISSTKGDIYKYVAWKEGKLVFENEPITSVLEELNRMFNVDIEVDDNAKSYTYTVTFIDEPLFTILDLMTKTTPVSYKAFPRKKLSDGTFSKQKIKIEKRTNL